MRIVEGSKTYWHHFSKWHYRGHNIGFVLKVFLLIHNNKPIGILVFGPASIASSCRNKAFSRTQWTGKIINKNFINLARIVLDPRYRGIGIVDEFIKKSILNLNCKYVELITSLYEITNFYKKIGFKFYGFTQGNSEGSRGGNTTISKKTVLQSKIATTAYFLLNVEKLKEKN